MCLGCVKQQKPQAADYESTLMNWKVGNGRNYEVGNYNIGVFVDGVMVMIIVF